MFHTHKKRISLKFCAQISFLLCQDNPSTWQVWDINKHNTMPQMSQVLRERAIAMMTAGMSTRAVARECNVNFSIISRLQHCFGEFVSKSNQLANVNVVNRVPHGGSGGYGTGRHKLWTTNIIAFCRWQFEFREIPWRDPEPHCHAIHLLPSAYVSVW